LTSILNASIDDKKILEYEKNRLAKNPQITIESVKIAMKKELDQEGWYGIVFDVVAKLDGKTVKAKDIVFTNGEMISNELFNIKTKKSYKDFMKPKLTQKYYNDEHLIAGNKDAKHKIVLFSDPLCPFCIEYAPELIKDVQKNPNKFALYYYHFPLLSLHPDSNVITKAMHIASQMGIKDVTLKTYQGNFYKDLKGLKNSDEKVLKTFNKIMKTNIKIDQINSKEVKKAIEYDIFMGEEAMVQGTPTVFFDGVYDKTRYKYDRIK
jgi:thiol-disulfide isomerase/thioredoxin